jgi:hypothetical protein
VRLYRIKYHAPEARRKREAVEFEFAEIGARQDSGDAWLVEAETDTIRLLYQRLIPRYLDRDEIAIRAVYSPDVSLPDHL